MIMRKLGECKSDVVNVMIIILLTRLKTVAEATPSQVSAMFVFGDSLVDNGNNNYIRSLARANYYPYGCDFDGGSTGRFTNGRTMVDVLGSLLGLPYVPPFADPNTVGNKILGGVNFASAAAGILDETGRYFGERYSLRQQVENMKSTVNEGLRRLMSGDEVSRHLAKSMAVMVLGSNDYINNYLLAPIYSTRYNYTPSQYAAMLLDRYSGHIASLHGLGLRKFLIAGVGPLGCIPNQRANRNVPWAPPGQCVDEVNRMVGPFNQGLRSLVDSLNRDHGPGAVFLYGNTYGAFEDILNRPGSYGFGVVDRACCGIGRNRAQVKCLPMQLPCANRNEYLFWDAFHPSDAANAILASRAYSGPLSDCYPFNVQQMALL